MSNLNPLHHLIERKIILGSASPRRRSLLADLGVSFDILVSNVDEVYASDLALDEIAPYISKLKLEHLKHIVTDNQSIIITADSIVVCDDQVLGKPDNLAHAEKIIAQLSDNSHIVYTAVCMCDHTKEIRFQDKTVVHFGPLTSSEIGYYVHNYQVLDRAGAYGIQDWIGLSKVTKVEGSFYNVMGLPVHRVYQELLNW